MDKNKNLHDGKTQSRIVVVEFINNYISELDGLEMKHVTCKKSCVEWRPPDGQTLKLNFDAAYDDQHHKSTFGIIVRNTKGEVMVLRS